MTLEEARPQLDRGGVGLGASAHVVWGLFPAFWPLLDPAAPVEILAHRILWTMVLMAGVLTLLRGWSALRALSAGGWLRVAAAALLITVNWGTFIYGVVIDRVVDIALGYYISPLVSALLAVLVLRERPNRAQTAALLIATVAVVVISVGAGSPPWLGLVLAASFGAYGLLKKTVPLPSTASLTAEGLVVGPLALAYVVVLQVTGQGTFTDHGGLHATLMILAGPATAIPLLLYGAAARRIPLTTLGTLTYITPTLQFLWGVLVLDETMAPSRWVGFGLVWIALAIFTVDLLRRTRGGTTGTVVR
ncbi:EamA family transporter RarD [Pseudonocardia pini]|uniref:EamA family transporter RarD n=1 Tax=Pseudonocardia pini TaxID=2758030 RepID=UPI0028AA5997|nr:EamA family transporter RarD [Pseudonocardia pini]